MKSLAGIHPRGIVNFLDVTVWRYTKRFAQRLRHQVTKMSGDAVNMVMLFHRHATGTPKYELHRRSEILAGIPVWYGESIGVRLP